MAILESKSNNCTLDLADNEGCADIWTIKLKTTKLG